MNAGAPARVVERALAVEGGSSLPAASRAPADVRYDVRDGNAVLFGAVGWGRVNRRRYIQIAWIPIPVGKAGPPRAAP